MPKKKYAMKRPAFFKGLMMKAHEQNATSDTLEGVVSAITKLAPAADAMNSTAPGAIG